MKRVMIVGGPGSGKSTLARLLGERTGLPVHHMDHIHWLPNWVERTTAQKLPLVARIEAQDRWIFEGGVSTTYENRARRADLLIWLDMPVGLRLWRVTKRLLRYWGQARPDLTEGCREGFHAGTVPFYWFIWTSRHRSRAKIRRLVEVLPEDTTLVHLRSPLEVREFLEGV